MVITDAFTASTLWGDNGDTKTPLFDKLWDPSQDVCQSARRALLTCQPKTATLDVSEDGVASIPKPTKP